LEYSNQALHTDRYYGEAGDGGQEFITFRIDAVWERGKAYGFLLSFHMVDFVLALHAEKGVKIWLRNSKWLWRKCPARAALPVVNNFVAWEEQIIMLKTGSKSIPKWQRYNRLKFDALRKRI